MDAKRCDRCNKFYDPGMVETLPKRLARLFSPIPEFEAHLFSIQVGEELDLCPKCSDSLTSWFKEGAISYDSD